MSVVQQEHKSAPEVTQEAVDEIFRNMITGPAELPAASESQDDERCGDCRDRDGHIDHCGGCVCCL